MNKSIDMVLVTFNPDLALLKECLSSVVGSVRNIYIVDNSDNSSDWIDSFDRGFLNASVSFIRLHKNMGVAYAQNIGIKESIKNAADFVLLSDQDTVYPPNFISHMLNGPIYDEHVCAISPLFDDVNSKNSNAGFYKDNFLFTKKVFPSSGYHELFHTISSGLIIKTSCINDIGLMDEKLFIDWVDYDWCWRAGSKGFKIIGNANVIIKHQLGDVSKSVGFRSVNLRSPLRHYYITRNAFYLSLYSKDLKLPYKIIFFLRSFKYLVGFPILSSPHFVNLRFVCIGFLHALIKKLGRYNHKDFK